MEKVQKKQGGIIPNNYFAAEINLETIGFFSPTATSKGRPGNEKVIEKTVVENGKMVVRKVSIVPNVKFGRPITIDLDIYRAFLLILKDMYFSNGKIENPISFQFHEITKLMGKIKGGKLNKKIENWMKRMVGTSILSDQWIYHKSKKERFSKTVTVFQEVITYGSMTNDGIKADRNFVYLSEWFLNNINAGYVFLIDYDIYKNLKHSISKVLYGYLWGNFFAIKESNSRIYRKSYSELCKYLDITEYKYESKIREKLEPAQKELMKYGVIGGWDIEHQKNGEGFNIKWVPGKAFEEYYNSTKKYLKSNQIPLPLNGKALPEVKTSPVASELINYFHSEIKGKIKYQPNDKEIVQAGKLLELYGESKARYIVKYAIFKIKQSGFDAQFFGAILSYVNDALEAFEKEQLSHSKTKEKAKSEFNQKVNEFQEWAGKTPEERIQGKLNFWIERIKTFEKRTPSEKEIEEKKAEYIAAEPTPEEKQKQLFGSVIYN